MNFMNIIIITQEPPNQLLYHYDTVRRAPKPNTDISYMWENEHVSWNARPKKGFQWASKCGGP